MSMIKELIKIGLKIVLTEAMKLSIKEILKETMKKFDKDE